jgi:hypothetical protein
MRIVVAIAIGSSTLLGQAPATSEARDLRNFGGDIWAVWSAPARMDGRDALIVGAAFGGVALTTRIDSLAWHWISTHQNSAVLRGLAPFRDKWVLPLNETPTYIYAAALSTGLYAAA